MTDDEDAALSEFARLVAFAYKVKAYADTYGEGCQCIDCDPFGEMRPDTKLPPLLEAYIPDLNSLGKMARDILLDKYEGDLAEMDDDTYFKVYEVITS